MFSDAVTGAAGWLLISRSQSLQLCTLYSVPSSLRPFLDCLWNNLFLSPFCHACQALAKLEVHSVPRSSVAIRHRALERLGCTQYTTATCSLCTKPWIRAWQSCTTEEQLTMQKPAHHRQRKLCTICVFTLCGTGENKWSIFHEKEWAVFFSLVFHRMRHVYPVIHNFWNNTWRMIHFVQCILTPDLWRCAVAICFFCCCQKQPSSCVYAGFFIW